MKMNLEADEYLKDIRDLDIETLYKRGFRVIFLDIDNTLSPYYEKRPDDAVRSFLQEVSKTGFRVFILSNNTRSRVETYCEGLSVEYCYLSLKPFGLAYEYLIGKYKLDRKEIICIGDQLLTDILGGKIRKLYTIYVEPLGDKDNLPGKISRFIEKEIFHHDAQGKM